MMREALTKSAQRKDSWNLLCHLLGDTRGECDCSRGGCTCLRAPLSNEPYFSAARQPCGCDPDNCFTQVQVVSISLILLPGFLVSHIRNSKVLQVLCLFYEPHPLNATPLNQLLNHDVGSTHKVCTKSALCTPSCPSSTSNSLLLKAMCIP